MSDRFAIIRLVNIFILCVGIHRDIESATG